jgi:hypothetical protein
LAQRSEVADDLASWQEKLHITLQNDEINVLRQSLNLLRCEFIAVGGTTMLAIAAETRSI